MEFISAEEFLKQPVEIQKVFLKWWKPQMYDLSFKNYGNNKDNFLKGIYKGCIQDNEFLRTVSNKELSYYPLLTEGQLRKFIEEKTGDRISIKYRYGEYILYLFDDSIDEYNIKFENSDNNLFRLFWKVAIEVAREEIKK